MVKTPGTCRRISVLWTKHSSTNKLDNSETIATTTMNKAKMISAKSMSHSRKSTRTLPAPVVANENFKSTMVAHLSGGSTHSFHLDPRASARRRRRTFQIPRALSSVLNPAVTISLSPSRSISSPTASHLHPTGARVALCDARGSRLSAATTVWTTHQRNSHQAESDLWGTEKSKLMNDWTKTCSQKKWTQASPRFLHVLSMPRSAHLEQSWAQTQVVTLQLFTVEFCTDRPLLPISVDVEAKGADKLRHVFLNNGKRLSRHQMAQDAHAPLLLIWIIYYARRFGVSYFL